MIEELCKKDLACEERTKCISKMNIILRVAHNEFQYSQRHLRNTGSRRIYSLSLHVH
jgi:hypothetical protein